jgi:putative DNA primase/helicase
MAAVDLPDLQAELTARLPDLAEELLGPPTFRSQREWRWGRHGSLAVVIAGAKAGCWFDHEAGIGGRMVDLIARQRGTDRTAALTWSAARIGQRPGMRPPVSGRMPAATIDRSAKTRQRAADIWNSATPAPADHPYLLRKRVGPHDLRCDASGNLIVPLRDAEGVLHTVETITPAGDKRYLAGGAKAGHFCAIGGAPEPAGVVIICEGWATGASLHEATGQPVAAAMDAGNLGPVARYLRGQYPAASIIIVADNDDRPGRNTNPGVSAATKAASAIDARLAIPPVPGDANDLACGLGAGAVSAMVAAAALPPSFAPTYAEPDLSPQAARDTLARAIGTFMAEVPAYWRAFEADAKAATPNDPLDLNVPTLVLPPLLGLQVDVGLGKTSVARQAVADLLAAGGLGTRKVVFAVPRHDLGTEQVRAFAALGVAAMLWKGRTAPDPSCDNPDRLMCLDPEATFDALEVEQAVEQSCCKVKRGGVLRLCPQFHACGYQRQKPVAQAAQVIVCAHDSLFHMKPEVIGKVGLLVIDEAFWQAGLRGLDGKAVLTQDGLEPGRASISCFRPNGKFDVNATAELTAARHKLWKALTATEPGPLKHGLLVSVGLTAEECCNAAILERRRLRDPGLLPGMDADERRRRIEKVLPPFGAPWAPPGRCAALWSILATALENGHDAGGAVLVNEMTANGSIRALRLRWRDPLRVGWASDIPVLHLDATLREALVRPYLPSLVLHAPVAARLPHVRFRQVLDSPTTAKALTPSAQGAERDRLAARHHLRDVQAYITLRARECQMNRATRLLVVGQKAAVDALRSAGRPANRRRGCALQRPQWAGPVGRRRLPDRVGPNPAGAGDRGDTCGSADRANP